MKHFRKIILSLTIILCTVSANPVAIIRMKIESTPNIASIESVKDITYPKPNNYRFTRSNKNAVPTEDSKIMRIIDVHQTPRMLGNERGAKLHIANGAYPVYYSIARVNGQFHGGGKYIRSFAPED